MGDFRAYTMEELGHIFGTALVHVAVSTATWCGKK